MISSDGPRPLRITTSEWFPREHLNIPQPYIIHLHGDEEVHYFNIILIPIRCHNFRT